MRWLLLSMLFGAFQALASQAGANPSVGRQPASIAVVHTLSQLLAQPRFTVEGKAKKEISVRLGIETDRACAGSGILIYAAVDHAETTGSHLDNLGPLTVKVHREGAAKKLRALIDKVCREFPEAPLYFFAKSISFPVSGRYHLEVLSPGEEQVLAAVTIDVSEAPEQHVWHGFQTAQEPDLEDPGIPWAGFFRIGLSALPRIPGDEACPIYAVGADGRVEGAEQIQLPRLLPVVPGEDDPAPAHSDLGLRIAQLIIQLGSEHYDEREAATRRLILVGRRAEAALTHARDGSEDPEVRSRANFVLSVFDGPFSARLENGLVILEMRAPFDPAALETHLLARWWVNGKPMTMHQALQKTGHLLEQMRLTSKAALAIDLKPLQLAATDQVEVEFLYCPQGIEEIPAEGMLCLKQICTINRLDAPDGDLLQAYRNHRSNLLRFNASALKAAGDK